MKPPTASPRYHRDPSTIARPQTPLARPSSSLSLRPNADRGKAKAKLSLCVLGSGSGGNSSVLQLGSQCLLLDAGLGPMTTARRLDSVGLALTDIQAICLTHLDQDHFRPTWAKTLLRMGMPVYVHRWHMADLHQLAFAQQIMDSGVFQSFDHAGFEPIQGLTMLPMRLAHDTQGTYGFRIQTHAGDIGYATDMGHVPTELIDHFAGVNLLAIESNYDPDMQRDSGRPLFLQRRITGHSGHLSNQQAFDATCQIYKRSVESLQHIVLLHRSAQCNHVSCIDALFEQQLRLLPMVTHTHQDVASGWISVQPTQQVTQQQLSLGLG